MTNIGIIGCGNISDIYLKAGSKFPILHITACADIDQQRAQAKANQYNIHALSVDELLSDPSIDLIINLTIPGAHAEIDLAAIEAGKSVYSEKPLALDCASGRQVLEAAHNKGLRVGCAPDTFLGGGLQTCRKLIDEGIIGEPVAATANMISHGHENWHPNPAFYYQPGGGPMFDMGPYYLTALVSLMGPVARVNGSTRTTFPQRTITSQPLSGQVIDVQVPTHVVGLLDFANGAIATIVTTFDVWASTLPWLEIYGTEGSMRLPDPNTFGGPVFVRIGREKEWREMPLSHGYAENSRGLGVADMAHAIENGRDHRANGTLAYHILDIMCAIHDSSDTGQAVYLESTCQRPAMLPPDLSQGILDE
jgi:predicted dehydrogenase